MAEEILEIQQQSLQAGAGDVDQTQFGLRRGRASAAPFGDILAAGSGLDHLIGGTGFFIQKLLAEPDGRIEKHDIADSG
jgi:hypothetical protein